MTAYKYTNAVLKDSGWFQNRCIDSAPYEKFLFDRGLSCTEKAKCFFSQFGGLKVSFTTIYGLKDQIDFDVLHDYLVDATTVEDDEILLETKLVYLGSYSDGVVIVTMDESGGIYSSIDAELYMFGTDFFDAVSRIVHHDLIKIILRPYDSDAV